jgi:hypothetical protein
MDGIHARREFNGEAGKSRSNGKRMERMKVTDGEMEASNDV